MTDAMTPDAAPPSAATTHPPREYPQALRGPRHRWWRPLVGLAAMVAGLAVIAGVVLVVVLIYVIAESMGAQLLDPASDAFLISPVGMLVTNLMLALGIPLALLATLAQARRAGLVSSVLGRVRWRLLLGGLGLSLLLLLPLTLGSDILLTQLGFPAGGDGSGADAAPGADESGWWPLTPASGWLALSLVVLLTTPLQAAGEEYFFRGWLSQWMGSLLKWRWLAIVLPALVTAVLFALAHGAQSPWLFADRLVFGLLASLLVWRTGGLEVAVALHAANNLLAFGFAIAYDGLLESLLITEVAPLDGAVSIAITTVTAAVLLWWARRRKPALVVTDPVIPAAPGPRGPVAPLPVRAVAAPVEPVEVGAADAGPGKGEPT